MYMFCFCFNVCAHCMSRNENRTMKAVFNLLTFNKHYLLFNYYCHILHFKQVTWFALLDLYLSVYRLTYHCFFLCSFLFRPLHSLSCFYLRLLTTSLVSSGLSDALYIRCIYYEIPVKLIASYLIECTIVFLYCVI